MERLMIVLKRSNRDLKQNLGITINQPYNVVSSKKLKLWRQDLHGTGFQGELFRVGWAQGHASDDETIYFVSLSVQ